ncbi:MAG: hypothetical protein HY529_05255 [Chloroflexi bacterium]|nr:hypothetical protein [Chloroflexota bacterium]
MDKIGIEIARLWDNVDDDGWVSANDGSSQGKIHTDWEEGNHLKKMGKALRHFPRKVPDQYSHEIREEGEFPYLVLRAHADNLGHTLLDVAMKSTRTNKLLRPGADYSKKVDIFAPGRLHTDLVKSLTRDEFDGERLVSFKVEPSAVHRLGELLLRFSERQRDSGLLKYRILRWSPNPDDDTLVEWEHPKLECPKRPKMDPTLAEWERLKKKHPTPEEKAMKKGWTFGPNDWYVP